MRGRGALLTLVIPTKNRASFVARALRYYAEARCPFPMLLGDSSEPREVAHIREAIRSIGQPLAIHHIVESDSASLAAGWQGDRFLASLIAKAQTPYVAFYADDDFAVIERLHEAVRFLEEHQDYSFACGEALLVTLSSGTAHGEVASVARYPQQSLEEADAPGRLSHLLTRYTVLEYGVSRTAQMQARWERVFRAGVDNLTGELINGCLVAIQGKVRRLSGLALVRQSHPRQTSTISRDLFDWVSTVAFPSHYAALADAVVESLQELHGVGVDRARAVFKRGFWRYLSQNLSADWQARYAGPAGGWIAGAQAAAKRVPGLRRAWRGLRVYLPGRHHALSLEALCAPASAYDADFMPIYRAMTMEPVPTQAFAEGPEPLAVGRGASQE